MKVIIGAGPAGLYTAIKLRNMGVQDLVIYDPRAGNYTRPGHLNSEVFIQAEFGIKKKFWTKNSAGHIKDLERALYAEAQALKIKIERKSFIRLHEDSKTPGVVIDNGNGVEEIVSADYVFDCSGQKRVVIQAVNDKVSNKPFQLNTITEVPIKNHFLAYVQMNDADWNSFENASYAIFLDNQTHHIPALNFARSIIKLRALGWNEMLLPGSYGRDFGKNKVCLYMNAPDNLSPENHDQWVQAVLESYDPNISYKKLPPSQKPRFQAFTMLAQSLNKVSYQGKTLPTVIALGDAQIDFDYFLAHGILDGMQRIDSLFKHMIIDQGKILYFDPDEYLVTINSQLRDHKQSLNNRSSKIKQRITDALETSKLKLKQAKIESDNESEKVQIDSIIKEIEARQSYLSAKLAYGKCHDAQNKLLIPQQSITDMIPKLASIENDLLKAYVGLPASFVEEQQDTQTMLLGLATSWKELGNVLFTKKQFPEAIAAYNKALGIYNTNGFSGKHLSNELPIYSNMAIVYISQKMHAEAIESANMALSIYERCPSDSQANIIREKIIANLIKALCAEAQNMLAIKNKKDAHALHAKAVHLVSTHEKALTPNTQTTVTKLIEDLRDQLSKENSPIGSPIDKSPTNSLIPIVTGSEDISSAETLTKLGIFGEKKIELEDEVKVPYTQKKLDFFN